MAVLGELSDNEIFLGHRGRYYFDITVLGTSAHTCHKPLAVNANLLAAHAVIELDGSRLMPPLDPGVAELFGPETYMSPGRIYGGLPPGGPSMIPDECVIRVDCRPQPGVTTEQVRAEIDRCLARPRAATRASGRRSSWSTSRAATSPPPATRCDPDDGRRAQRSAGSERPAGPQVAGWLGDTASFGAKVPTVIFGPGGEPVYCPDEHLSVADIIEATQVYAAFGALALTGDRASPRRHRSFEALLKRQGLAWMGQNTTHLEPPAEVVAALARQHRPARVPALRPGPRLRAAQGADRRRPRAGRHRCRRDDHDGAVGGLHHICTALAAGLSRLITTDPAGRGRAGSSGCPACRSPRSPVYARGARLQAPRGSSSPRSSSRARCSTSSTR